MLTYTCSPALVPNQRVYIDPEGWLDAGDPAPFLPLVQQAVWEDRVLRVTYQDRDGRLVEWDLEAWALVAWANAWYLVGRPAGEGPRSFRVARIIFAALTGLRFERPAGFNLAEFWQEHRRDFAAGGTGPLKPFETVVRVREPQLWMLVHDLGGRYSREAGGPAGWVTLRLAFPGRHEALARVLSLGPDAEALDPPDFRQEVRQKLAETFLKRYT